MAGEVPLSFKLMNVWVGFDVNLPEVVRTLMEQNFQDYHCCPNQRKVAFL
jgi:hypothetical protein